MGIKAWKDRIVTGWTRVLAPPPIAGSVENWYKRGRLFGQFSNGYNIFEPYRIPVTDATGGGTLNYRSYNPLSPNLVVSQTFTPVSITGDGAELTGSFNVLPLVDVSSNSQTNSNASVV